MKIAVITLAFIGVLATLGVLFFAATYFLARKRDLAARQLWETAAFVAGIEQQSEVYDVRGIRMDPARDSVLRAWGIDDFALPHSVAMGYAIQALVNMPDNELVKKLLATRELQAYAEKHGSEKAEILFTAALLAVSCERIKRLVHSDMARAQATELLARSLLVIWPDAVEGSSEFNDAIRISRT